MGGNRMKVRPHLCGNVCVCCDSCGCCSPVVDAVDFYTSEERRLAGQVEAEKLKAIKRPVGVAFVTFATHLEASKVRRDHTPDWKCGCNPSTSSLSTVLRPHRWTVTFAPRPDEINW